MDDLGVPLVLETPISHPGERKIIDSKVSPWYGNMLISRRIFSFPSDHECHAFEIPEVIFHVYVEQ